MRRGQRAPAAVNESLVNHWNTGHPVGTRVRYWKGRREGLPSGETVTRSRAEVLYGGAAVVWLEGVAGCIALTHVEAIVNP